MRAPQEAAERATAKPAAERLTFFSDAVVAIAITLLAIELPAPVGRRAPRSSRPLSEHAYEYVTFLISFCVIGSHWQVHHRVFRYVARADGPLVRLDLLWLLLVVLQPFMTRVVNEGDLDLLRFAAYAGAQALQLSVMAVMIVVISQEGLVRAGRAPPRSRTAGTSTASPSRPGSSSRSPPTC